MRNAAILTLHKLVLVCLEPEEKIRLTDKVKQIKIVWQTVIIYDGIRILPRMFSLFSVKLLISQGREKALRVFWKSCELKEEYKPVFHLRSNEKKLERV